MKRSITLLFLLCLTAQFAMSQSPTPEPKKKKRAINEKEISLNIYYGYSLYTAFLINSAGGTGSEGFSSSSLGPIGAVGEYMVTENVGLGLEVGYSEASWSYYFYDNYALYGPGGAVTYTTTTYYYKMKYSLLRAQVRANYHFIENEALDSYFFFSAGYRQPNYSATSNDPDFIPSTVSSPVIFGVKPGIGIRYFFHDSFGLHMEVAAGTPIVCGGVTFKL